jgi:hypothetical protein
MYRGLSLAAAIATRQIFTSSPRYRDCASKIRQSGFKEPAAIGPLDPALP